jgi:formylglycine-generating enzyme required for sulfatase activity
MINSEWFVGKVIDGRYRLTRLIGKGAFGWVFEANHETLGQHVARVAVKLITPDGDDQLKYFIREIQALAQLRHDSILAYLNSGQFTEGIFTGVFLVTELAEMGLEKAIWSPTKLTDKELEDVARNVASALNHIHSKGAVHRDVKPANILRVDGKWKLADFGLARAAEKSTSTTTGVIGTPAYMAPEYLMEGTVSPAMDVYSLGMTLLEAITGVTPYSGETHHRIIVKVMTGGPQVPADLREPWKTVITGCLERDPQRRWTADQILQHLRAPTSAEVKEAAAAARRKAGPQEDTLSRCEFDVVRVDSRGRVVDRRKGSAQFYVEDMGGGVAIEMVEIPGGSFQMGSPNNEAGRFANEGPIHTVMVSPYFLSRYPITQAQWRKVAQMPQVNMFLVTDPSWFKGDQLPVEQVSWEEAMEFCARLARETGREYRLPAEAEWEYACRAGTRTPFHFGETITSEIANFNGNDSYGSAPKGSYRQRTTPVGGMGIPNTFGLYDMHGNVWEWCLDAWHENYIGAPANGAAWEGDSMSARVLRGGGWLSEAAGCRAASRGNGAPAYKIAAHGFRIARSAKSQ